MFVSGAHSLWQESLLSPVGVPIGGLRLSASSGSLQKYLKELHQIPGIAPPGGNSMLRTTPCVVLRSSTPPGLLPSPPSPLSHTESPSPSPSPRSSSRTNAPSSAAPKLKFGVERLLSAESSSSNEDCHRSQTFLEMSNSSTTALNPTPFSITSPSLFPISLHHHASSLLSPVGLSNSSVTSVTSRACSPPCGCETNSCNPKSNSGYIFSPLFAHTSSPFLPFGTVFNPTNPLGSGNSTVLSISSSAAGNHLSLNRDLVNSTTSIHGAGVGSGATKEGGLRRKRSWTRAVFSTLQRKGLEKRFHLQKYITKPDRRQLAATLGLTDAQVKVWFQNRRMKWRHAELRKIKINEEQKKQTTKLKMSPQHQPQTTLTTETYFSDTAQPQSQPQNQQQQSQQTQQQFSRPSSFPFDSESDDTDLDTMAVMEGSTL